MREVARALAVITFVNDYENRTTMTPTLECYSREQLRDYALGRLSDELSATVELHLRDCSTCDETIASIDDSVDSLVSQIRGGPRQSRYEDSAEFQRILKHVQATSSPSPAETDSHDASASLTPNLLRDYELLEPLGHGGMGTVYRARHVHLQRDVAIKLLPRWRMEQSAAISRFQREMQAVGQLDHPAIVRATDAGVVDGTHYLVMECVDGFDLSRLVRRVGRIRPADACELVRQAASGIHHAHQQRIVHRDVKPSNLMLTRQGQVKVLDLGLALLAGPQAAVDELTTVGQLMGTLDYMAPEQCGDSHEVDARADVYGLCATLYKLLCGEAPYSGGRYRTPLQKLRALATSPAPPIESRVDGLPTELAAVVGRGLSMEPDDRFANAAELAAALEPFARDSDLLAMAERMANTPDLQALELHPLDRWSEDRPHDASGSLLSPSSSPASSAATPAGATVASANSGPQETDSMLALPYTRPLRFDTKPARVLLTLALLFALVAAGVVFRLRTGTGELVIESFRDDVEIAVVQGNEVTVKLDADQGTNRVRLRAGEYQVQIVGTMDDVAIDQGRITVERGGQTIVRLTQLPIEQNTATKSDTDRKTQRSFADDESETYEGRTFDEWKQELRRERSPTRQATAISALVQLGGVRRAKETVKTVVTSVRRSDLESSANFGGRLGGGSLEMSSVLPEALAKLPEAARLEGLAEVLREGASDSRYLAIFCVWVWISSEANGLFGEAALVEPIIEASQDEDAEVRAFSVDLLLTAPDSSSAATKRLAELIDDMEPRVAASAATAMAIRNPQHHDLPQTLVKLTRRTKNRSIQALGITGLAKMGPRAEPAIAALAELIEEKNETPEFAFVQIYSPSVYGRWNRWQISYPGYNGQLATPASVEDYAIYALGEIGPAAKRIAPQLAAEYARRWRAQQQTGTQVQTSSIARLSTVGKDGIGGGFASMTQPDPGQLLLIRQAYEKITGEPLVGPTEEAPPTDELP